MLFGLGSIFDPGPTPDCRHLQSVVSALLFRPVSHFLHCPL
jgi:hypothetical protein